ncbi:MAG: hypothetical protein B7X86_02670 [Sphingobacteriales bacterium 17-39-43]|uniref:hypothetical protein n=1 Tax=Daejeonella sp. TaxID=2805397 RepID=UPI000BDB5013|nr:hypothetical protein [Daejeonella sp.]OYZ33239.1 MAG: hypothetical protein B7Y24_02670 [Sphingobacteriales bacterium 16-39-50]OZA26648.1 MAG: hypothetical protein B7X86_02670 [Sphingobacteriales bacterium 17-39-43]HQS04323.1 hypothetical protein [Daejeonella sp.]HQT21811.1 hypothetical protein [Daejeonella sp.]HQT56542.1 hypothetical protein [Daejeonella sp.]
MKNTETSNQRPILVKIAAQLLKDQQELDSLAVQLSLGKAEAKDKFEEAKKQMKKSIQDFKNTIDAEYKQNKEWSQSIDVKLTDLESLLSKGIAESREIFTEQKKSIIGAIERLENEIKTNPEVVKLANYFTASLEKIKLQMELFEMEIEGKKIVLTELFKDEMKNAREVIVSVSKQLEEKKDEAKLKAEKFNDEIRLAYDHFKKAIKSL